MPLPRRPVWQSSIRAGSKIYDDSEEVIRAIEALEGEDNYGNRRNFLLQSGKIKLVAGPVAAGPGSRAVLVDSRDKVLASQVKPYVEEGDSIKKRIAELKSEIDRIGLLLDWLKGRHDLLDSLKKPHKTQENIVSLQTLYAIEHLQKEEEIMRLQDRLKEVNEIIRSIYRKYEDIRDLSGLGGGSTRSKTKKHKWSLKYKRSINCKHPKGFSQRQHCKYGRKNWTRKR
jgi:prefoldin subunit 5